MVKIEAKKSIFYYLAWIVGIGLLFTLIFFLMVFVYSAITGNEEILNKIFSLLLPLIR